VIARRTGYLLERAGAPDQAAALADLLANEALEPQPLDPARSKKGAPVDDRWALYVNASVEPDTP
jgi:hypothetical protein